MKKKKKCSGTISMYTERFFYPATFPEDFENKYDFCSIVPWIVYRVRVIVAIFSNVHHSSAQNKDNGLIINFFLSIKSIDGAGDKAGKSLQIYN